MKIRPVGTELFRADERTERRTDRKTNRRKDEGTDLWKLIRVFCDFVKDSKFLLSAPSSFPTVGRCPPIKDRTARLKNYDSVIDHEQG